MSVKGNRQLFAKFGLTDRNGRVVVPPVFDDVIVNDYFLLGKYGTKWGLIKELNHIEYNRYEFEDVMVFGNVMWFKQLGIWAACDVTGTILVEPQYGRIIRMVNSDVIRATRIDGARYEYFTTRGCKLCQGIDIFKIDDFENGYAMAEGMMEADHINRFFIVRADKGGIMPMTFRGESECCNMLKELRNDYIWSMAIGRNEGSAG